jgi:hypothetical protein
LSQQLQQLVLQPRGLGQHNGRNRAAAADSSGLLL